MYCLLSVEVLVRCMHVKYRKNIGRRFITRMDDAIDDLIQQVHKMEMFLQEYRLLIVRI